MPSHDIHVLAGEVGTESRTTKINNMLDEIDKAVSQAREIGEDGKDAVKISSAYLATQLNISQSTICRNGFPDFFKRFYSSTQYLENKGLYIETETWVEERKEQREKLADYRSSQSEEE